MLFFLFQCYLYLKLLYQVAIFRILEGLLLFVNRFYIRLFRPIYFVCLFFLIKRYICVTYFNFKKLINASSCYSIKIIAFLNFGRKKK